MANEVLLQGHKKLQRKLARLAAAAQRRIVRPAVRKALSPINKAAKRNCPTETKLLRKSIGSKVKVYRYSGVVWGGVGPRTGFKRQVTVGGRSEWRNPTKYAHLVEYGTRHSPAQPFLRPALDVERPRALGILASEVKARLEKEARRR